MIVPLVALLAVLAVIVYYVAKNARGKNKDEGNQPTSGAERLP